MGSIFKAYDIRGIVGETLTNELAYDIGRAYATFLKCRRVAVGQDMRPHSKGMFEALARGLNELGVDVIDVGIVSTPMLYYANGLLGVDGSIIITASHNPAEWNGFKLCREKAIPISGDTGIKDIERIVLEEGYAPPAEQPGQIEQHDIIPQYCSHIRELADIQRPLRVCIDFANGMGIVEGRALEGLLEIDPLFDTLDGSFPNHEANPLMAETYEAIQERMQTGGYDFGVSFDGDADRAGFLDEKGNIISMDMITALIAKSVLQETGPGNIFYDLRSSLAVKEVIEENGGTPMMSRVGHAFIKAQMREADAVFAGELSGHYYFKENYYTESSALAVVMVASLVSQSAAPLSEMIKPFMRYHNSGEINSTVADTAAVFERLIEKYSGQGQLFELDGISFEFGDWRFNVRASNTEPLVRLNLEADTAEKMSSRRDEVLEIIRGTT